MAEEETSKSVGTLLREAREAKGLSLEAVEADTNIRGLFLQYLEAEEYDKTPGEFFVKGAIRNYGNYLGLDGLKLVNMYKASKAGQSLHEVEAHGIREAKNVTMKLQLKDKRDIGSGTGKIEMPSMSNISWLQVGAGVAALVVMGALYFAVPAVINWSKGLSKAPVATTAPASKAATPQTTPVADKLVLELSASSACWLEVRGDGKLLAETTLTAGMKQTFEAKDKLVVKFGNIGAVNIKVNGKDMNAPGEHGVMTKVYTRTNLTEKNPLEAPRTNRPAAAYPVAPAVPKAQEAAPQPTAAPGEQATAPVAQPAEAKVETPAGQESTKSAPAATVAPAATKQDAAKPAAPVANTKKK